MNSANKITGDDIKKISKMESGEIEKKLKGILADSKNGAIKKMLSGINVEGLKKKLQSSSKEELESFMDMLNKIDPSIIRKIKDSLS